jgi:uncharacterized membrane protein YcaP (DUF421 family)
MFDLSIPWWELVVRAITVYIVLIVFIRLTGRHQIGELSPVDLILLLILSESVQSSMIAGDQSLIGGLIVAATLLLLNAAVNYITFKSRRAENLIDGRPQILIRHGKVIKHAAERALITEQELQSTLRKSGFFKLEDVKLAILEDDGTISAEGYENANEKAEHEKPDAADKKRPR